MNYDVINVSIPEHLHLKVTFQDGVSGEVIFQKSHLYGVFEALNDPNLFKQATCENGFVEWPGDIDLAPDAMYEEIKKHGVWELV